MVRVCIVPGCNSGSSADLKQRAEDGVRKCSLFRAPKDPLYRNKWADVLGIELSDYSKVCELHFLYEDLYLEDDLIHINNEWVVSVREKITLKKNAFPQVALHHGDYQQRKEREIKYCALQAQIAQKSTGEKKRREEHSISKAEKQIIDENICDDSLMELEHQEAFSCKMSVPIKKKVERKCCIPECQGKVTENTVFHKFPNDTKRKEDWIRACNITTNVTPDSLICGLHFTRDDYQSDASSRLRGLKLSAVPKLISLQNFEEYIMPGSNKQKSPTQHRRKCSVPQCNAAPDEKRSYHIVPKEARVRKQWVQACGLGITLHPYAYVCSAHFERADFITGINSRKQVLKLDAFPSLNLPKRTVMKSINSVKSVNVSEKEKPIIIDTSKLEDDEKVTTIIYVPENCTNMIGASGTGLKNSKIVLHKQDNLNLVNKSVFSQVQNSITLPDINDTEIEGKISSTQEIIIVKDSTTAPKQKKTEIQGRNVNTKNVQGKDNVNKIENQDKSNNNASHKTKKSKVKSNFDSRLYKKAIIRQGVSAVTLCADCGQYCKIEDEDLLYKSYKNSETLAAELLLELQEVDPSNEDERILLTRKGIEICNKAIQKQSINLMELLTNDNELIAFTGINFELLDKLTKLVSNVEGISSAKQNSPAKTRIVVCLCKLRINLSFACLGMLFGITQQICASNFFAMLKTLSVLLKKTIHWPKTEELLKDLPECFQSFKQTRVILNCSETQIEKQRCFNCQKKMAENTTKHQAVKLVLGVAPSGLIIFKSNVFESSSADVSVFTQTNILDKLDPQREAIMADKTLNMEAECAEHNITLIKLPKLGKNKQFSKHDVELIKNISTARIHVDRTLHRFKMYKIMQTKVHWRILPYLDDVCSVIAGIVNMKNPIPPNEIDIKSVPPIRK